MQYIVLKVYLWAAPTLEDPHADVSYTFVTLMPLSHVCSTVEEAIWLLLSRCKRAAEASVSLLTSVGQLSALVSPIRPSSDARVQELQRSLLDVSASRLPARPRRHEMNGVLPLPVRLVISNALHLLSLSLRRTNITPLIVGYWRIFYLPSVTQRDTIHDSLTFDPILGSMGKSQSPHEGRQEDGQIAESRTHPIYALVIEPLPDEIERGCFYHSASYICYGKRDPNINTVDDDTQGNVPLPQFHFCKTPTAAIAAPLPFSTQPATPIDDVNNGVSVAASVPASHQSRPPAIVISPPTDIAQEELHPAHPHEYSMSPSHRAHWGWGVCYIWSRTIHGKMVEPATGRT
ncbi:hypothetical protein PAXINDRAFT_16085 [Paxillus involutus ATCC 200175]|uniref:Uncharacterized protein n=1 Tax=Paxillus involutus ATCC 200175 TaxID=664439 RepID=A0A0C9SS68_PAXIN|nr:hypothetical protein PAXINDRAFT_16085 [Paxillus involutus ATCC 200175]